jgi:hypothetical protein
MKVTFTSAVHCGQGILTKKALRNAIKAKRSPGPRSSVMIKDAKSVSISNLSKAIENEAMNVRCFISNIMDLDSNDISADIFGYLHAMRAEEKKRHLEYKPVILGPYITSYQIKIQSFNQYPLEDSRSKPVMKVTFSYRDCGFKKNITAKVDPETGTFDRDLSRFKNLEEVKQLIMKTEF